MVKGVDVVSKVIKLGQWCDVVKDGDVVNNGNNARMVVRHSEGCGCGEQR